VHHFQNGLEQFLSHASNNFVAFSVREDYKQAIVGNLDSIKQI
jgi:hypothetical protein